MSTFESRGFAWGGTKSTTPSGAICVKTSRGYRYPLVFHTFNDATVEVRFTDYKRECFVEELLILFRDIEGVNCDAIRANGYGAKPKIEMARFSDPKVVAALLGVCECVSRT